jgi:hypothetical protein
MPQGEASLPSLTACSADLEACPVLVWLDVVCATNPAWGRPGMDFSKCVTETQQVCAAAWLQRATRWELPRVTQHPAQVANQTQGTLLVLGRSHGSLGLSSLHVGLQVRTALHACTPACPLSLTRSSCTPPLLIPVAAVAILHLATAATLVCQPSAVGWIAWHPQAVECEEQGAG